MVFNIEREASASVFMTSFCTSMTSKAMFMTIFPVSQSRPVDCRSADYGIGEIARDPCPRAARESGECPGAVGAE
jgi:hypothetical protein